MSPRTVRPIKITPQSKAPVVLAGCRDYLPDYDGCNQYEPVDMTIPYNVTALIGLALWTFAVAAAVAWVMS